MQEKALHTTCHNVLSSNDFRGLYEPSSLPKITAKGYLTRLIFSNGLVTVMHPTVLCTLDISQFKTVTLDGKVGWKIRGMVGRTEGESKKNKGGWPMIGEKPPAFCVWDELYADETITFLKDLDCYMSLRESLKNAPTRFFLAINYRSVHLEKLFKAQSHCGKIV